MGFRFRYTFGSRTTGAFRVDENSASHEFDDGLKIFLVARNGDTLANASSYHIEGKGFDSEGEARKAGENLRICLRVLNGMLGLGLILPVKETKTGGVADSIKEDAKNKLGATIVDSVSGLSIFSDDEKFVEVFGAGNLNAFPSDPLYPIKAISSLWSHGISLDARSEDSLNILNLANREASERASFLISFLALEPLVDRKPRSGEARLLVEKFIESIQNSSLESGEKESLLSAVSGLKDESFATALRKLAGNIQPPQIIKGKPLKEFLAECVRIRNKIAHNAELDASVQLAELTGGLREFITKLIWTYSKLPDFKIDIPATSLSFPPGALQIKIL